MEDVEGSWRCMRQMMWRQRRRLIVWFECQWVKFWSKSGRKSENPASFSLSRSCVILDGLWSESKTLFWLKIWLTREPAGRFKPHSSIYIFPLGYFKLLKFFFFFVFFFLQKKKKKKKTQQQINCFSYLLWANTSMFQLEPIISVTRWNAFVFAPKK